MNEMHRMRYDQFYAELMSLQDQALTLLGDRRGARLFKLLGDARREAEEVAPGGWSTIDLGVLPLDTE